MPVRKATMIDVRELKPQYYAEKPLALWMFHHPPLYKAKATTFLNAVNQFWSPKQGVPGEYLYLNVRGSKRLVHFRTWYIKNILNN